MHKCAAWTMAIQTINQMKAGILAKTIQWAKHLRPYWKRKQWKRERKAAAKDIKDQAKN